MPAWVLRTDVGSPVQNEDTGPLQVTLLLATALKVYIVGKLCLGRHLKSTYPQDIKECDIFMQNYDHTVSLLLLLLSRFSRV